MCVNIFGLLEALLLAFMVGGEINLESRAAFGDFSCLLPLSENLLWRAAGPPDSVGRWHRKLWNSQNLPSFSKSLCCISAPSVEGTLYSQTNILKPQIYNWHNPDT